MKACLYTILAVSMLLFIPKAYAQESDNAMPTEWMVPIKTTGAKISANARKKTNYLKDKSLYEDVEFVHLRSVADAQQDGMLEFKIPGTRRKFRVKATSIEAESKQDYQWQGSFLDNIGTMTIVSAKGQVRAHIDYEGETYEIFPVEGDVHAVTKIVPPDSTVLGCPMGTDLAPVTSEGSRQETKKKDQAENGRYIGCTPREIKVLIGMSDRAVRRGISTGINLGQTAELAVTQFNQALTNSGVVGIARLKIVGFLALNAQGHTFTETSTDPVRDAQNLATDPFVVAERDRVGADLVVVFTDGNYQTGNFQFFGVVSNTNLLPDPTFSLALVELDRATTDLTFVHEVGHLFGARHQNCAEWDVPGCDNRGTFNHGYNFERPGSLFRKTRRYRTIMHVIEGNYSQIQYFSNPDRTYDTRATGTAALHDNARLLEQNGLAVARFRTNREEMSVSISGNDNYTPGITTFNTYTALVSCGDPSHSYSWEVSFDGFNYSSAGTSDTYSPPYNLPPNSGYMYLRVRVRSRDGQTRTAYKTVSLGIDFNFKKENTTQKDSVAWWEAIADNIQQDGIFLDDAYPNPLATTAEVGIYLPQAQTLSLDVTDLMGRVIKNVAAGAFEAGPHLFDIERGNLAEGVYLYQLTVGKVQYTKRLLVTQK